MKKELKLIKGSADSSSKIKRAVSYRNQYSYDYIDSEIYLHVNISIYIYS